MFKLPFIKLIKLSSYSLILVNLLIATGCSETPTPTNSSSQPNTSSPSSSQQLRININTASIAELDKLELPGTKPSLSERIQAARPYKTTDDLVKNKAISAEELALIKDLVTAE
jgi:DNA uptake protein ComE-like DNA-binding protein